jgi:SAM-dependent methyltransferase
MNPRTRVKCLYRSITGKCPGMGYAEGLGFVHGFVHTAESSTGSHGIMFELYDKFGLGKSCLLIGENRDNKEWFSNRFNGTKFHTVDFDKERKADFAWDICTPLSKEMKGMKFDSIICLATFEHVFDPVGAMKSFSKLLNHGGHLYVHAPSEFPYHRYPIDCLRFYEDWFKASANYIKDLDLVYLHKELGHIFAVYNK